MTRPRSVFVELPVRDEFDALRVVAILNAISARIWEVYGEEMSDQLITKYIDGGADAVEPLPDDEDLPF